MQVLLPLKVPHFASLPAQLSDQDGGNRKLSPLLQVPEFSEAQHRRPVSNGVKTHDLTFRLGLPGSAVGSCEILEETVPVEVSLPQDYGLFYCGGFPRFTSRDSGGFTWLADSEPFSY